MKTFDKTTKNLNSKKNKVSFFFFFFSHFRPAGFSLNCLKESFHLNMSVGCNTFLYAVPVAFTVCFPFNSAYMRSLKCDIFFLFHRIKYKRLLRF